MVCCVVLCGAVLAAVGKFLKMLCWILCVTNRHDVRFSMCKVLAADKELPISERLVNLVLFHTQFRAPRLGWPTPRRMLDS